MATTYGCYYRYTGTGVANIYFDENNKKWITVDISGNRIVKIERKTRKERGIELIKKQPYF